MRNDFASNVGKRLRRARVAQHKDRQDVAEALGVTSATLGNWERGDRCIPTEFLPKLPAVLGRPVSHFLGMESDVELSQDEFKLLAAYRVMPDSGQRVALNVVTAMSGEFT